MQDFQFPLDFTFNIGTLSNDFTAVDSRQKTVAYVKQKLFKFKEDVSVFENESKTKVLYKIKADRWIDFSACYSFSDPEGNELGKIGQKAGLLYGRHTTRYLTKTNSSNLPLEKKMLGLKFLMALWDKFR